MKKISRARIKAIIARTTSRRSVTGFNAPKPPPKLTPWLVNGLRKATHMSVMLSPTECIRVPLVFSRGVGVITALVRMFFTNSSRSCPRLMSSVARVRLKVIRMRAMTRLGRAAVTVIVVRGSIRDRSISISPMTIMTMVKSP